MLLTDSVIGHTLQLMSMRPVRAGDSATDVAAVVIRDLLSLGPMIITDSQASLSQ
jgi:hypothetical protein